MSMNFAKNARAVAFNPTSAFPLDARSYFESLEVAQAAAATAVEVGSTDGVYYFGQTLTVVENNVASFYIIQPDGSLAAVAGANDEPVQVLIDENYFEYDEESGKLVLIGAVDATEGQVPSIGADGVLTWVTPIDAYTKDETDSAINSAVAAAAHLKRKIVDSVANIDVDADDADQYIYMIPNGLEDDDNRYDEYMVLIIADTRFVEKVGNWSIDLSDYAKLTDLDNYVKKVEGSRLLTSEEATKIAESEKNVIASVSSDFNITEERQLELLQLSISKVDGLQIALDSKVNTQDGYTLLSPTDQTKLSKLVIGDDGSVGVSGTINADNVKELDEWIETNRNDVNGLFSESAEAKLENLYDQVNEAEFEIATIGDDAKKQLNIKAIDSSKITNLESLLNAKADVSDVETLNTTTLGLVTKVEDIATKLNNYVLTTVFDAKMEDLDSDIEALKDAITWKTFE